MKGALYALAATLLGALVLADLVNDLVRGSGL